jgi:hypothetical protein
MGSTKINERDNYELDTSEPKFFKSYKFKASFPGAMPLNIDVMDYDDIFGDDLIGKTTIDLDDRFFNHEWQSLIDKPIEYRDLLHHSSQLSQGVISCWVDIVM